MVDKVFFSHKGKYVILLTVSGLNFFIIIEGEEEEE